VDIFVRRREVGTGKIARHSVTGEIFIDTTSGRWDTNGGIPWALSPLPRTIRLAMGTTGRAPPPNGAVM
jgi:hypothetical protein